MQRTDPAPMGSCGASAAHTRRPDTDRGTGGALLSSLSSDYIATLMNFTDTATALRWMIRRVAEDLDCDASLVDFGASGPPRTVAGREVPAEGLLGHPDVQAVAAGRRTSATVFHAGRTHHIAAVHDGTTRTVLVLGTDGPGAAKLPAAAAQAAWILGVHRRADRAERADRRLADIRTRLREVVFQLLCSGQAAAAQQVASSLGRTLPESVRLCVLEGIPQGLRARHRGRPEVLGESVWAFRAMAQHDAVVLLAPEQEREALQRIVDGLVAATGCQVGMSTVVPLREVGTGYEQALHALYAARVRDGRYGLFESRTKLAHVLGPDADAWAADFLRPLTTYEPPRRTAPDADELLRTARAWLRLAQHATRGLDIHRNTTRERLRVIAELLGIDLARVADQAIVSLALRLQERGAEPGLGALSAPVPLSALLDAPEADTWAAKQLHPLLWQPSDTGLRTVRCWLDHDARMAPTAAALGLSPSATRKRLLRASRDLGRALFELPGARHDLWLALQIHDRAVARSANPGVVGTG